MSKRDNFMKRSFSVDIIKGLKNILDENTLQDNIKFAALFILNFECLKEFIVTEMRDFFEDFEIVDGNISNESKRYKKELKKYDPKNQNKLTAAINWFYELEALSQEDIKLIYEARNRRNAITHELMNELMKGFSERDIELYGAVLRIYKKLDCWCFNEIEAPIMGKDLPENYDKDGVASFKAVSLNLINEVALDKGDSYSNLLDVLNEM